MPHFYFSLPEELSRLSHAEAVQRYAEGAGVLAEAIQGLTAEQLTSRPVRGTWSIQEIVLHLLDSDLIASHRMKRILAEDNPRLEAYDETAFAARLYYHELDPALACEMFRLNRRLTAATLRRLGAAEFDRGGVHAEAGRVTLGVLVRAYAQHLDHHLRFLREKKGLVIEAGHASTHSGGPPSRR